MSTRSGCPSDTASEGALGASTDVATQRAAAQRAGTCEDGDGAPIRSAAASGTRRENGPRMCDGVD